MHHAWRRQPALALLLATACALAGCKGLLPTNTQTGGERQINLDQALGFHTLQLRRADGKPYPDGQVTVNGRKLDVKNGQIQIPEADFQAAAKAGGLVIAADGYLPMHLALGSPVSGLNLLPLTSAGSSVTFGAEGGTISTADGSITLAIGRQSLSQAGTQISLFAYNPDDPGSLRYQQDIAKIDGVRGVAAPALGACQAPFACLPVQQALGVSVSLSAPLAASPAPIQVTYDLDKMLHGWDGTGTAPWIANPAGWTPQMIAEASSAASILATFAKIDADPDKHLRETLQNTFDLALDGHTLTFQVAPGSELASTGVARIEVPGSELLGARLEVELTTPQALAVPTNLTNALQQGITNFGNPGGTSEGIPADGSVPAPDRSGEAALKARASVALNGTPAGSSLANGVSLTADLTALKSEAGASVTGNQPPGFGAKLVTQNALQVAGATGTSGEVLGNFQAGLLDPGSAAIVDSNTGGYVDANGKAVLVANLSGLVSNNAGGQIVANNAGGLISNNSGGLVSNNSAGQIIANNAGQIIANNAGGLVSNNAGSLEGFPYMPFRPAEAKYDLMALLQPANAPMARVTAAGVQEYLWPNMVAVRAIDITGTVLSDWAITDSRGKFHLTLDRKTPPIFFLEAFVIVPGATENAHSYTQVYAPGSSTALVAIDSATTMMTASLINQVNFLPAELGRLAGVQDSFYNILDVTQDQLADAQRDAKHASSPAPGSNTGSTSQAQAEVAALQAQVDALNSDIGLIDARLGVLAQANASFRPTNFGTDTTGLYNMESEAQALATGQATLTQGVYNALYGLTSSGRYTTQSLMAVDPTSPF